MAFESKTLADLSGSHITASLLKICFNYSFGANLSNLHLRISNQNLHPTDTLRKPWSQQFWCAVCKQSIL